MTVREQLLAARAAAPLLAALGDAAKRDALCAMADEVERSAPAILQANETDLAAARGKLRPAMIDRLTLTPARIGALADGMRQVAALPDPVGEVRESITRPNGLRIDRVGVPLGVVAIIYESRPNVTGDAAALAFRSGNACVLRSGKEAHASCAAIVDALHRALAAKGLPCALISLVESTDRSSATELMTAVGLVDLLIPRGGAGLIRACVEQARVPCIQTGTGICHLYVDGTADVEKAVRIAVNAKTSRPSVCNAAEVCLVAESIAPAFLPRLKEAMVDARLAAGQIPVELRTDAAAHALIGGTPATAEDFDTEFLDYILAVKVVPDVEAAVAHIAAHSTGHSEAVIAEDAAVADYFVSHVDSAAVYVNASTRFTDGGEFGLGCEMGISTQKLHARGPMGLRELTSYKYVVRGDGQIR